MLVLLMDVLHTHNFRIQDVYDASIFFFVFFHVFWLDTVETYFVLNRNFIVQLQAPPVIVFSSACAGLSGQTFFSDVNFCSLSLIC